MKLAVAFSKPRIKFFFLPILLVFFLLYSFSSYSDDEKDLSVIQLKEGENAIVPGTSIRISVKSVIDMTSTGCLGGPIGCRDRVVIEIIDGKKIHQNVTLEIAKTPEQKKQKIDQTVIEGKTVRLAAINKKEVEFVVEESGQGQNDR